MTALAHLCLGTASWATDGPPYNGRTPPSDAELARILDVAEVHGIRWLDTARSYGNVWKRLTWMHTARFNVIDKVKPDVFLVGSTAPVILTHLGPDDAFRWPGCDRSQKLCGASVYTLAQATAALDAGVQALQVPWNMLTPYAGGHGWMAIRDRAYADGVLFFGRQPFAKATGDPQEFRTMLRWALQSNPRGWCVVGVETAAQVEELVAWREAMA